MACYHLITIKNPKTGEHIQVPCGHCIGCLEDMQRDWTFRMIQELKSNLSRPAVFVTLTYNDENLPTEEVNEQTGEVFQKPSVVKRDIQLFMKSLRKAIDTRIKKNKWKGYKGSIKYFFTSEYGPEGGRPHYHGIIYGLNKNRIAYELINGAWRKGFIYLGVANEKTITYCAKYCCKPTELSAYPDRNGYFDNEKWMEDNGIRRKPFRLMSSKLGANYIESPSNLKFHLKDPVKHNYVRQGQIKRRMPRYYKNKIYTKENLEKYCTGADYIAYVKQRKNIKKLDKEYGRNLHYYDISDVIGRSQYYRHLADTQQKYAVSEDYIQRDIEDAKQRENISIQNRRKWFKREGRYHEGGITNKPKDN